jgi:transcriptional regulator with XRE-family HTH domain
MGGHNSSDQPFAVRLDLALRVLNISRVRLAASVGVDKSLVSRWVSGKTRPTSHNVTRISEALGTVRDGFSAYWWDLPFEEFRRLLGISTPTVESAPEPLPANGRAGRCLPDLPVAALETSRNGRAYFGLWQLWAVSPNCPGQISRYWVEFRPHGAGMDFRMGGAGLEWRGLASLAPDVLWCGGFATDDETPLNLLGHAVRLPWAEAFEGIMLCVAKGVPRRIFAEPVILERIADLIEDPQAAEMRWLECRNRDVFLPEQEWPEHWLPKLLGNPDGPEPRDAVLRLSTFSAVLRGSLIEGNHLPLLRT